MFATAITFNSKGRILQKQLIGDPTFLLRVKQTFVDHFLAEQQKKKNSSTLAYDSSNDDSVTMSYSDSVFLDEDAAVVQIPIKNTIDASELLMTMKENLDKETKKNKLEQEEPKKSDNTDKDKNSSSNNREPLLKIKDNRLKDVPEKNEKLLNEEHSMVFSSTCSNGVGKAFVHDCM